MKGTDAEWSDELYYDVIAATSETKHYMTV